MGLFLFLRYFIRYVFLLKIIYDLLNGKKVETRFVGHFLHIIYVCVYLFI